MATSVVNNIKNFLNLIENFCQKSYKQLQNIWKILLYEFVQLFGIAIAVIGLWLPDSNDPGLQIQTIFDECFIAFGLTLFLICNPTAPEPWKLKYFGKIMTILIFYFNTISGICGALGVANNNPVLLRCFMTMMIILLLTQLSVVIYAILGRATNILFKFLLFFKFFLVITVEISLKIWKK